MPINASRMSSASRALAAGLAMLIVAASTGDTPLGHSTGAYSHDSNPGYSNPDWLSRVKGCLPLSALSLPGTHDTMSFHGGDAVQTQTMSLATQLDSGIRVFDIRLRHIEDSFALHHGSFFQHAFFGADVMEPAIDFLQAHPNETVLMRVKEEYDATGNTRTFAETFAAYMTTYGAHVWTPTNTPPTLADVRGKIVILQDFPSPTKYGLYYSEFDDQDNYNLGTNWDLYDKWVDVRTHLNKANNGSRTTTYINYLSGATGAFPYFVASGHSSPGTGAPRLSTGLTTPGWKDSYPDFPRVDCFLGICTIAFEGTNVLTYNYIRNGNVGFTGIVMSDFPGGGLIDEVIKLNPTNGRPIATAGGSYSGTEGSPITFSAAGSTDPDGDGLQYRWDFDGDGTWDTGRSTSPTAVHTYADDWTGTARVAVYDGCEETIASASVTVRNVPPAVSVVQIADGDPFILTNLAVNFVGAFADPGADTHIAQIAWTGGEPPSTTIAPATSPIADSRVFQVPATYPVTLTVTDDDGGTGQVTTSVKILGPAGATEAAIAELRQMTANPHVDNAVASLEGQSGGRAANGALDHIGRGQGNAAMVKIGHALASLYAAEAASGGELTTYKKLLTNIARSLAIDAIEAAERARQTRASVAKVESAKGRLARGISLQKAGDYRGAVAAFHEALQQVQGAS